MSQRTQEIKRLFNTLKGARIKVWTNAAGPDVEGVISEMAFPYCVLVDTVDLHTGECKGQHYITAKYITRVEIVVHPQEPRPSPVIAKEEEQVLCSFCGNPLGDFGGCDHCDSEETDF